MSTSLLFILMGMSFSTAHANGAWCLVDWRGNQQCRFNSYELCMGWVDGDHYVTCVPR